jgi:hypothetical protein
MALLLLLALTSPDLPRLLACAPLVQEAATKGSVNEMQSALGQDSQAATRPAHAADDRAWNQTA